jgi:hypothetical protein
VRQFDAVKREAFSSYDRTDSAIDAAARVIGESEKGQKLL